MVETQANNTCNRTWVRTQAALKETDRFSSARHVHNIGLIAVSPANIYLFKVNHRNTRKKCEICSKLTIKPLKTKSVTSFWCFYSEL